jgi:hypothetical protein
MPRPITSGDHRCQLIGWVLNILASTVSTHGLLVKVFPHATVRLGCFLTSEDYTSDELVHLLPGVINCPKGTYSTEHTG